MLTSGGFDPLHVGHLDYLKRAAKYGDVVVALNSDDWLVRKKGFVFMEFDDRRKLLRGLRYVNEVVKVDDRDGTVCSAIEMLKPDIFAKGGDRTPENTPERELCAKLGIDMVFGLGGKIRSSSELVNRQWGHYQVLVDRPGYKVKVLTVLPGKSTSLQKHFHRKEHWIFPQTDEYEFVDVGHVHQLSNPSSSLLTVVEVQTGDLLAEEDIERL